MTVLPKVVNQGYQAHPIMAVAVGDAGVSIAIAFVAAAALVFFWQFLVKTKKPICIVCTTVATFCLVICCSALIYFSWYYSVKGDPEDAVTLHNIERNVNVLNYVFLTSR